MTRALQPTSWTRPQQLVATAYGVWSAFWTLVVGFVLMAPSGPAGADQVAGIVGVTASALICLAIAFFSHRGGARAFVAATVWFTITGLGAVWVPLRPAAHAGEDTFTLVVHAFVDDLPGLFVGGWLIIGLARYGHTWARRAVAGT